jgi:hypothetical protein
MNDDTNLIREHFKELGRKTGKSDTATGKTDNDQH